MIVQNKTFSIYPPFVYLTMTVSQYKLNEHVFLYMFSVKDCVVKNHNFYKMIYKT